VGLEVVGARPADERNVLGEVVEVAREAGDLADQLDARRADQREGEQRGHLPFGQRGQHLLAGELPGGRVPPGQAEPDQGWPAPEVSHVGASAQQGGQGRALVRGEREVGLTDLQDAVRGVERGKRNRRRRPRREYEVHVRGQPADQLAEQCRCGRPGAEPLRVVENQAHRYRSRRIEEPDQVGQRVGRAANRAERPAGGRHERLRVLQSGFDAQPAL
jgi:hypothetical protein